MFKSEDGSTPGLRPQGSGVTKETGLVVLQEYENEQDTRQDASLKLSCDADITVNSGKAGSFLPQIGKLIPVSD